MLQEEFLIRPISMEDYGWLYSTTSKVGAGFTSLPHDEEYLHKRIEISTKSFRAEIPIKERIYIFVRERLPDHKIVGMSGIQAVAGNNIPFYNYKISSITQVCEYLNKYIEHKIINIANDFQDASEMISLFLDPEFRGHEVGKWLSKSRFMFIAQFPELFGEKIIAEIRGVSTKGNSPFWEAVGRKFFEMDFSEADYLTMTSNKQYISDLMPRETIYLDLLPPDAQEVIGCVHPTAQAALHLLESEGFTYNNYIDIFDAGPLVSCHKSAITTISKSRLATVSKSVNNLETGFTAMLSNTLQDFRMTIGRVDSKDTGEVIIENRVAELLNINIGGQIRFCKV